MAKAHTLVDGFDDDELNTQVWSTSGVTPQEVGRRLEIHIPTDANYGSCTSRSQWDLTGSFFQVEVVQPSSGGQSVQAFLKVIHSAGNRLYLYAGSGTVRCRHKVSGVFTDLATTTYDPARHRWLRIREDSGVAYWETSPDGRDWSILVSRPTPFDLLAVQAEIGAQTEGSNTTAPSVTILDNFNLPEQDEPRRITERRLAALGVREEAAALDAGRPHGAHVNNDDEVNYPTLGFIGNYSKGLRHDAVGDPEPVSYGTLLRALESEDPHDFEEIILGPGGKKLTNPQSGFAFHLEGPDTQEPTMPPAPRFDSEVEAHEQGELYWMALARDVAFVNYASDPVIQQAISSLNGEFPSFGGTVPVTAQNVFRGIFPGEQVGPYVSQFLWKGNSDPRKMPGGGRNSTDGYVAYGSQVIDQRQQTVKGFPELGASADYLVDFPWWLRAQNGEDFRGNDQFDFTTRRFIRNLRDGANYVHFDLVINAWYNAAWILASEPTGDQVTPAAGAVPMRNREFPKDAGNPYEMPAPDSPTEAGFVTFGDVQLIEVLTEVIGRSGRAVWWQKWGVHRRLRPEEYGGRVHNHVTGVRAYPLDPSITTSLTAGLLAPYFGNAGERYPSSYLLPQAYPEGAPTHPAYGAGHATISGACVTILKAFFDESKTIESPVQANALGTALVAYAGPTLTVGGELNKLANNISLFRNAAGVHWRADHQQSLILGEAIAIRLLQELSITFNEDDAYFQLTRFDGSTIRIRDGFVDAVPQVAGS